MISELINIKRLIIPLIKGLPLILLIVLGSLWLAERSVQYMTPMYETTTKIKLDDSNMGVNNTILYKDFDLFPRVNKIATEAEVIQSEMILKQVVEDLNIEHELQRLGSIRSTTYYKDTPIDIDYRVKDDSLLDKDINVLINSMDSIEVNYVLNGISKQAFGPFDKRIKMDELDITVTTMPTPDASDPANIYGHYVLKPLKETTAAKSIKEGLHIMSVDKDVPVLRVSYKDANPERAANICNAIAEIYIRDYVYTKSEKASKTSNFINDRLAKVKDELKKAETELKDFKTQNKIINLKQETETGIKKIAELEVQLANLEMNEAALNELERLTKRQDSTFDDISPQIGFGDLLFTEMVKNLKEFQKEKNELLLIYTDKHEDVIAIEQSIVDTKAYLLSGIVNARNDIQIKRQTIADKIAETNITYQAVPELEKDLFTFERNFQQLQKTYQLLKEKHTEASIASASSISFHRILQKANIPTIPISPNKTLILFVSGFLGMLGSIFLIYLFSFLNLKLRDENDISKNSSVPLLGKIPKTYFGRSADVDAQSKLAHQIIDKMQGQGGNKIAISSLNPKTGKTYNAIALANAMAGMGWKTLLIDANLRNPSIASLQKIDNVSGLADLLEGNVQLIQEHHEIQNLHIIPAGHASNSASLIFNHKNFEKRLNELTTKYDYVIIDCPATEKAPEALTILKLADLALLVGRKNKTRLKDLIKADIINEDYTLNNMYWVLNGIRNSWFDIFKREKSYKPKTAKKYLVENELPETV